jgi:tetratricopeptide (TPR) repeat protein
LRAGLRRTPIAMVGEACNDLACQLRGKREYEEAARLFRRALDIFRVKLNPRGELLGICRANLAMTFDQLGRDDEARALLEEALASWEDDPNKPGKPTLDHRRMAAFLIHRQQWQEAAEHAEAAIAIVRGNAYQLENWAASVQELANARRGDGRLAEAAALHVEVDSLRRENGRVAREGIGNLLEWGTCLREMGHLDEAAQRLDEAHARWLEEFGDEHEAYPEYLIALAELDADRGAWDSARSRAGDARATLAAQTEAEARGLGIDWLGRKVRRANLARADSVLGRARAAGYALHAD